MLFGRGAQFLSVSKIPSVTVKAPANAVIQVLKDWNLQNSAQVLYFDTQVLTLVMEHVS